MKKRSNTGSQNNTKTSKMSDNEGMESSQLMKLKERDKPLNTIVKVPIKRWMSGYKKLLIILFIFTISFPVSAQLFSPSKILLTFSEPMSRETIFDPANYIVTANDNIPVQVIKVGLVKGDSSVVLFFDKDEEWVSFQITVHNLEDKAGNLINADKNVANVGSSLRRTEPVTLLDN